MPRQQQLLNTSFTTMCMHARHPPQSRTQTPPATKRHKPGPHIERHIRKHQTYVNRNKAQHLSIMPYERPRHKRPLGVGLHRTSESRGKRVCWGPRVCLGWMAHGGCLWSEGTLWNWTVVTANSMSEESMSLSPLQFGLYPHQQAQQGGSAPPWAALTSLSPTSSRTPPGQSTGHSSYALFQSQTCCGGALGADALMSDVLSPWVQIQQCPPRLATCYLWSCSVFPA